MLASVGYYLSHSTLFSGNFSNKLPNNKQLSAGLALIVEGIKRKIFSSEYEIFGASQLRNTQSPGDEFLKLIKTWPHASQLSNDSE